MWSFRILAAAALAAGLAAQQEEPPMPSFRATVNVVVAPVSVTDSDGAYVNNLKPSDFRLLDNGKPQDIKVDVSSVPISLVVAVQSNWDTQNVLPKIQKIGSLLQGMLTGEQGEVAILSFDHRIQVLQDFTTDPELVSQGLEKLRTGSTSSRMIDAAMQGIRMLSRRPPDRRRILLLISQTRDRASENSLREALTLAQLENVLVYTVNINRLITSLTTQAMPPRPDPLPPSSRPMPAHVPPTPETVRGAMSGPANSVNFIPIFVEIFRQVKAIFVDNPLEVFTEYTGGREYSFVTQRDLERAIMRIGEELHSQYLISYQPNNKMEAGFHEIKVEILDSSGRPRRDLRTQTRAGYWLAAVPDGN